jgi:hypothetical protein
VILREKTKKIIVRLKKILYTNTDD